MLSSRLIVRLFFILQVCVVHSTSCHRASATALQLKQAIVPSDSSAGDFFGGAVSLLGDTLAVHAHNRYNTNLPNFSSGPNDNDDFVYRFENIGDTWTEINKQFVGVGNAFPIGQELALQHGPGGSTILMGLTRGQVVPRLDIDFPSVRRSRQSGLVHAILPNGQFERNPIFPFDPADSSHYDSSAFGRTLAVDGDLVIVGASNARTEFDGQITHPTAGNGAAMIFQRVATGEWQEIALLTTPDLVRPLTSLGPRFGTSVDISGGTAIVGAIFDKQQTSTDGETPTGSAFVFRQQNSGDWQQVAKLNAPGTTRFGQTVAINGDTAIVTSFDERVAHVFQENHAGDWELTSTFDGGDTGQLSSHARSVAIDDGLMAVGFHNGTFGWVDVYSQDDLQQWSFSQRLFSPIGHQIDYFGFTLSLDDGRLAISDPGQDTFAAEPSDTPGAVFVFAVVPEPSTLLLVFLGFLQAGTRRFSRTR